MILFRLFPVKCMVAHVCHLFSCRCEGQAASEINDLNLHHSGQYHILQIYKATGLSKAVLAVPPIAGQQLASNNGQVKRWQNHVKPDQ